MPKAMSTLDLAMGATIAIVLCVYLIYALVNPEKF
ncbi:MAG: K(+)-transporting ATPase subunit F [Candidatus Binataceae bacterium]